MCTIEETQKIVNESERKMEAKIVSLKKELMDKIELSHSAVSKNVSDFGDQIRRLTTNIEKTDAKIDSFFTVMKAQEDWRSSHTSEDILWKKTHVMEFTNLIDRLNTKIETDKASTEVSIAAIKEQNEKVNDTLRWLMRLVVAGVILAVLGLIFN